MTNCLNHLNDQNGNFLFPLHKHLIDLNFVLFLAGIGIDDMFVIVQCWDNLKKDPDLTGMSLPDKIGMAMKHAGVSITVTSLTDVFAFGVGAVTVS